MDSVPSPSPFSKPNPFKSILLNRISLIIITAILLSGIGLAATYFLTQQRNSITEETSTPEDTQLPASELVKGQISRIKDNLLTLKQDDGQEIQVKIATGAAILKQKRFGPNSIGTIPASSSAQVGSSVSASAVKNSDGNLEANLIVILDPDIKQ